MKKPLICLSDQQWKFIQDSMNWTPPPIKGKGSLLHLVVDKEGKPLWITSTSAKGNKKDQALVLLDHLKAIQIKNSKKKLLAQLKFGNLLLF